MADSADHIPVNQGNLEDLEACIVKFDDEDIRESVDNCSKSLIGKLLSDRSFSVGTLESALHAIWRHPEGFRVLLNLQRWQESLEIKETSFIHIPIWIQLWGVPEHCKTRSLALKVGEALGTVLDADLFQLRGGEERILKVLIRLDITLSLRRSLKISGSNGRVFHLQLKYERIGNFCHYCGFIGHEIRSCNSYLSDSVAGKSVDEHWGPWIRADQVGWRLSNQKENIKPNVPSSSSDTQQKAQKPTPINLLRVFANLSFHEGNSQVRNSVDNSHDDNRVSTGGNKEDVADSNEVLLIKDKPLTEVQASTIADYVDSSFRIGSNSAKSVGKTGRKPSLKQLARKRLSIKPG